MRVIAGKYRGRVLYRPRRELIRPTADRLKEFIFNYIGAAIQDASVLDLFSGTGNLTIEALSRGAQFSISVDNSKAAIRIINRNLELTHSRLQCQIVQQDALKFLNSAIRNKSTFDLILADPPYATTYYHELIELIGRGNLLCEGGFFILEHSARIEIKAPEMSLSFVKTKIFGDSAVTIYSKKGN